MKEDNLNLTPKIGVLTYAFSLATSLVLSFAVSLFPEGNAQTLASYFTTQIPFLIIPFLFFKFKKLPYFDAVPVKNKINPWTLLLALPISIGAFMQNTILSVAFNWLLEALGITANVSLPTLDTPLNVCLAVTAVCILPAVSEEFLFRGIMLSSYRERGIMGSCLFVSIIFALSHFNVAQLLHQVILGFILCYVTASSRSIWYAVSIHLINNVIALFIGKIIPAFDNLAILSANNALILFIMSIIGMVILLPSLYVFSKTAVRDNLKIEGNPFKVFSKKSAPLWHAEASQPIDAYTIGLTVFMLLTCLITTFIN